MNRQVKETFRPIVEVGYIAEKAGVSTTAVRKWVKNGTIPKPDILIGQRRRWYKDRIDAFLREKGCEV